MNRMFKTHTLPTKKVVAAKQHDCTWCGCLIKKGETHHYWRSVGDSYTENRMHFACLAASIFEDEFIYKPKKHSKKSAMEIAA